MDIRSGAETLGATLWEPERSASGVGVLLVGGSGQTDRTNGGYFTPLIRHLTGAGHAVLTYDKRGSGTSTGDWASGGVDELADDASAAFAALTDRSQVSRVGVFGHSEGGWVALRVCARRPTAFLILNSCPAVSFLSAETDALAGAGIGLDEATSFFAGLRHSLDLGQSATEAWQRATRDASSTLREVLADDELDDDRWEQLKHWIDYSPEADLVGLTTPALAVFGELDSVTPVRRSVERLDCLPTIRRVVFQGADHRLQIDRQFVDGYLDLLTDWIADAVSF